MISVITVTGDRPETFDLCKKWMDKQTILPQKWTIIDDGKVKMEESIIKELPPFSDYIRREPQKHDPLHTMLLNIKTALPYVKGDSILFWEDDEYYAPTYIEEMSKRLTKYEIVGIGRSKYYHFPTGMYLRHDNMGHASLAQTAFNSSFLSTLNKIIDGDMFLDIRMWMKFNGAQAPLCADTDRSITERKTNTGQGIIFDDGDNCLYVGIKGLPGRSGIGSGHRDFSKYIPDSDGSVFKKWIPKDYKIYLDSFKKIPISEYNGGFMGTYKATKRGLIGRKLIEDGEIFSYDGPKGSWMEPVTSKEDVKVDKPKPEADIFKVAADLAKNPPSVLPKTNIPQAVVAPEKEPVKMTGKRK